MIRMYFGVEVQHSIKGIEAVHVRKGSWPHLGLLRLTSSRIRPIVGSITHPTLMHIEYDGPVESDIIFLLG